jgi:putative colanic acid biosynthesis acetyltransferase WcaF
MNLPQPSGQMILDAKVSRPTQGGPSFTIGQRIYRALWNATWLIFAAWTPPPLHRWRILLLRLFGADVAWSALVYGSARIWYPPLLKMERLACLGPRANCYDMAAIVIREYAVVSQGAHLCAGTHDIEDPAFQLVARPIVIEKQAWIAAEAFVGPGVIVGEGAVLGARGVAFRDLAPGTVYIGNPATPLRTRAATDTIPS